MIRRFKIIGSIKTAVLDFIAPLCCPVCSRQLRPSGRCLYCRLPDWRQVRRQLRSDSAGLYLILTGGEYQGDMERLVRAFKYQRDPAALSLLADQAVLTLPEGLCWDALIPVPAHPVRIRERGEAITRRLAQEIGNRTGIAVSSPLRRTRYTKTLTGLGAAERREVLQHVLEVEVISGNLLLVDDVFTTGATFNACRRKLLAAGATGVDLLAVAKTPPNRQGRH
jgi:ComF family protein